MTADGAATADGAVPDGRKLAKPTAAGLGVDLAALDWQRSGTGAGSFEVAFIAARRDEDDGHHAKEPGQGVGLMTVRDGTAEPAVDWVLLRVAGDPAGRVLVYDRTEWLCFIDGVARGEFDLPV